MFRTKLLIAAMAICITGAAYAESTTAKNPNDVKAVTAEIKKPQQKRLSGDTDGDGRVSKAEYLSSSEKRFAKIDTNGDGYISREEKAVSATPAAASAASTALTPVEPKKKSFMSFFGH